MCSNVELVEFPATCSAMLDDIRDLKEQIGGIKKQLARHAENIASRWVVDGHDSIFSSTSAVEDTTYAGIDNATFSLPLPQCHTLDVSLGKELKQFFLLDNKFK